MTERAAALGGELTAGPRAEGGGFEIVARLPTQQGGAAEPSQQTGHGTRDTGHGMITGHRNDHGGAG
jgi:hypothetical protein